MWKYVKPLENEKSVIEFHKKYNIKMSKKLLDVVTKYNGGRPTHKLFNTIDDKEYVFKSLLSYNENDLENIYSIYPSLFKESNLFPIATDAAGNMICVNKASEEYYLWEHEQNSKIKIVNLDKCLY